MFEALKLECLSTNNNASEENATWWSSNFHTAFGPGLGLISLSYRFAGTGLSHFTLAMNTNHAG